MFIGMTTAPTIRSATERLMMYRFPTVCSFRSLRTAHRTSRLSPTVTKEMVLRTTTRGISWWLAMVVLFPSHILSSKMLESHWQKSNLQLWLTPWEERHKAKVRFLVINSQLVPFITLIKLGLYVVGGSRHCWLPKTYTPPSLVIPSFI